MIIRYLIIHIYGNNKKNIDKLMSLVSKIYLTNIKISDIQPFNPK